MEISGGVEEDFAVAFDEEGVLGAVGSLCGRGHFGVDEVGEEVEGAVDFFGEVGFFRPKPFRAFSGDEILLF